jgi:hypothetical protein
MGGRSSSSSSNSTSTDLRDERIAATDRAIVARGGSVRTSEVFDFEDNSRVITNVQSVDADVIAAATGANAQVSRRALEEMSSVVTQSLQAQTGVTTDVISLGEEAIAAALGVTGQALDGVIDATEDNLAAISGIGAKAFDFVETARRGDEDKNAERLAMLAGLSVLAVAGVAWAMKG